MKKLALLLSAIFLVSLLSACASTGMGDEMKVKCPACGYEWTEPNPYSG